MIKERNKMLDNFMYSDAKIPEYICENYCRQLD